MIPSSETAGDIRKVRLKGELADLRFKPLSPREVSVVALVGRAKVNKDIAFELGLTVGTVKVYLCRIFRKTGVTSRTELALWYRDR